MKVLICDDEPLARQRMAKLIEMQEGYETIGFAENGADAVELVRELKPDVLLLDIRMPEMDGIEAARKITNLATPPAIIFCTAFNDHALDAFQVSAVSYLLKPVKRDMLSKALQSAGKVNKAQILALDEAEKKQNGVRTQLAAKTHKGLELIPVSDILYFVADQKYVSVVHEKGRVLIDESLKQLEEEFDSSFVRIHRSTLVALNRVNGLRQDSVGKYSVDVQGLDELLPISRRHLSEVRKLLKSL